MYQEKKRKELLVFDEYIIKGQMCQLANYHCQWKLPGTPVVVAPSNRIFHLYWLSEWMITK